jgi:protein subunit release factor A
MALNIVSPEKQKFFLERMRALGVREHDIEEHFVRSSGAGGENVNVVFVRRVDVSYGKHRVG